ncbi:MAG: DUF2807 domain-containing protein [Flavobacteriaceae bacterium]|nr:DUF2807 domain-containing protein [Flavobacteriaceae bacterium]
MKPYTLLLLLFNFLVFSQTPISKSLGEFSELKIYDLINIELIESTENKIEITGANATDVIVIQKNDILRIRMALHKSFNGSKTFIKLFYTKIHTIDVNEGAKVVSESTFKQYELELKAQEGGTISVKTDTKILTIKSVTGGVIETSGTTEAQNLNIRTRGAYNGSQLKALNSKIKIKAGGDVDVNSSDLIEVRIIAGGNLTIHGTTKHLKETNRIGGTISFKD